MAKRFRELNSLDLSTVRKKPDWRWSFIQSLEKHGVGYVRRHGKTFSFLEPAAGSQCLSRHLRRRWDVDEAEGSLNAQYTCNTQIPSFFEQYLSQAGHEETLMFFRCFGAWRKSRGSGAKMKHLVVQNRFFHFGDDGEPEVAPIACYNLAYVEELKDPVVVRLIKHLEGVSFDRNIHKAIQLYSDPEQKTLVQFIHYCFFARLSTEKVAAKFQIPVGVVDMLRQIYFDYSYLPYDRLAVYAHLRQIAPSLTKADFVFCKQIYDLGELGLNAQVQYHALTEQEKKTVRDYLAESLVTNTLQLKTTIETREQAERYQQVSRIIGDVGLAAAKTDFIRAQAEAVRFDTQLKKNKVEVNRGVDEEGALLFEEVVRQLSLSSVNQPVKYVSKSDLLASELMAEQPNP